MLESSFLSPSWELESFLDWPLRDVPVDNIDSLYNWNDEDTLSACDFSSNSSDVDGLNLYDLQGPVSLSDAFVSQILGDDADESPFFTLSTTCTGDMIDTNTSTKKFTLDQFPKSWSNMSLDEKEKSLLCISEITCQMAIREQLEVIRIIDPSIQISADMKEFTLDVSLLNDTKYRRIRDYFKKHKISFSLSNSTNQTTKSQKTSKSMKKLTKKPNSVSRTSRKQQRQKKQKIPTEDNEFKKLRRKQVQQGMKEERSGLFVYEKIIKFSSLEEDEDVNILE